MIHRKNQDLEWLEFEQFQDFPEIKHGIFLRTCGDFKGNLPLREKLRTIFDLDGVIFCRQKHGTDIITIEQKHSGLHTIDGYYDASITKNRGVGLSILHADCQATIFYDPVTQIIANVHSGWRGSVQNIYSEVIDHLKTLGSLPENLHVCISPSLGPTNAEFTNYKTELPPHFHPHQVKPLHFDFWEISKSQLLAKGILSHHIEIAEICTHENENHFHSYRRDKTDERNATLIARI